MRGKKSKQLRRMAETMTVGRGTKETRKVYQRLKSTAKAVKHG